MKKKEPIVGETDNSRGADVAKLSLDLNREDLNLVVAKLNELIDKVNG